VVGFPDDDRLDGYVLVHYEPQMVCGVQTRDLLSWIEATLLTVTAPAPKPKAAKAQVRHAPQFQTNTRVHISQRLCRTGLGTVTGVAGNKAWVRPDGCPTVKYELEIGELRLVTATTAADADIDFTTTQEQTNGPTCSVPHRTPQAMDGRSHR
jgi:hypothetical protein